MPIAANLGNEKLSSQFKATTPKQSSKQCVKHGHPVEVQVQCGTQATPGKGPTDSTDLTGGLDSRVSET